MQNTQTKDTQNTDKPEDDASTVAAEAEGPAQSQATVQGAPNTAEDADLIEKEWVYKAKEIVESTKDNPRAQSEQIQHVRADYIKKRYNRNAQAD